MKTMKQESKPALDTDSLTIEAVLLWESGQAEAAFPLLFLAAVKGNATAQHNIGFMYDTGEGIARNTAEAFRWYKRAWAKDRQTGTCCNIAQLYAELGNPRQAVVWWKKAMTQGDGDAALDYANFLLKNRPRSRAEAVKLLKVAAQSSYITQAGREEALELLGTLSPADRHD